MNEAKAVDIWACYFMGFAVALYYKWARAIYHGKQQGKSIKQVTLEWIFEPSVENAGSWIGTIAGVWVFGSIYINRIISVAGITDLPLDRSIGFFLGSIFEFVIPNMTKWIVSRFE